MFLPLRLETVAALCFPLEKAGIYAQVFRGIKRIWRMRPPWNSRSAVLLFKHKTEETTSSVSKYDFCNFSTKCSVLGISWQADVSLRQLLNSQGRNHPRNRRAGNLPSISGSHNQFSSLKYRGGIKAPAPGRPSMRLRACPGAGLRERSESKETPGIWWHPAQKRLMEIFP